MKKILTTLLAVFCSLIVPTRSSFADPSYISGDVPTYRGKLILLVDDTMSADATVGPKINRLVDDLNSDGWQVLRHDVTRGPDTAAENSTDQDAWSAQNVIQVRQVKAIIKADYDAAPDDVKVVFLLGRIAVPYSGDSIGNVGGHHTFKGAQPSDTFYGELIAGYGPDNWTDWYVDNSSGLSGNTDYMDGTSTTWSGISERLELRNIPGDGKFDLNNVPGAMQLAIGRVDFYNMTDFYVSGATETTLMARYLDKDHDFRRGNFTVQRRAWSGTSLGGPGSFSTIVGSANEYGQSGTQMNWFPYVGATNYLLGYGDGDGGVETCYFVGTTGPGESGTSCPGCLQSDDNNFVQHDSRVVFDSFYGSIFGIWDEPNNFLRAALANPYDPTNSRYGYGLVVTWHGFGFGNFYAPLSAQKFGLGACFGQAAFDGYNSPDADTPLMGDPSLRAFTVLPASSLTASNSGGTLSLSWTASSEAGISGYNVYYSPTTNGPWTLANLSLITGTSYSPTRPSPPAAPDNFYMVRAVITETIPITPSVSYVNMSEGIMVATPGTPVSYVHIIASPASQTLVEYPIAPRSGTATPLYAALNVDAVGCDSTGSGQLTYQWYKNSTALTDSSDPDPTARHIQGATTSSLLISGVDSGDASSATYHVVVTSGSLSATSSTATLTINQPPVAYDDTDNIVRNTASDFHVLSNDTTPNTGTTLTIKSMSALSDPSAGVLTISMDQTYFHFVPSISWTGAVTFTYIMTDGVGDAQATATINVSTTPGATAPTVTPSTIANQTINEDTSLTIPFTVSDLYTAVNDLQISATSSSSTLVPDANISFTRSGGSCSLNIQPGTHQVGTATITLLVKNYDGLSTSISFDLTVIPLTVPTLLPAGFAGSDFNLGLNGSASSVVTLYASDNLYKWTSLGTVTLDGSGLGSYTDSGANTYPQQFYYAQDANGSSVNVAGFIHKTIPANTSAGGPDGSAFIANQLNNPLGNTLDILMPDAPNNTVVYKLDSASYTYTQFTKFVSISPFFSTWLPYQSPETLDPGHGFFIQNPTTSDFTVTFMGDVPQGSALINDQISSTSGHFAYLSSVVPWSLGLDAMNFPGADFDEVYLWNQSLQTYGSADVFFSGAWFASTPTPAIGEAFNVTSGSSGSRPWTENFVMAPIAAPTLSDSSYSGGVFQFTITGTDGAFVDVEATQDFVTWTSLGGVSLNGGTGTFTDTSAGSYRYRFYNVKHVNACSVNTVGFINVTVPGQTSPGVGGEALVANQLNNPTDNTIDTLLTAQVPNGTQLYKYNVTTQSYDTSSFSTSSGWLPSGAVTLNPGEAAFIQNPTASDFTITFIGSVPQGGTLVNNGIPSTLGQQSVLSSIIPESVGIDTLGFPVDDGDRIYHWNSTTQTYDVTSTYVGMGFNAWFPSVTLTVGEGFLFSNGGSGSRSWTESFSVCP